jgi:hypothetical protein
MRATCPARINVLDLITLTMKRTSYEAPHYSAFSSLLPLPPSWAISATTEIKMGYYSFKN